MHVTSASLLKSPKWPEAKVEKLTRENINQRAEEARRKAVPRVYSLLRIPHPQEVDLPDYVTITSKGYLRDNEVYVECTTPQTKRNELKEWGKANCIHIAVPPMGSYLC